jgi:hypothetical protein
MRYFNSDSMNKKEIKAQYRKLALELHPDKGGDPAQFRDMQEEYEQMLKGNFGYTAKDAHTETEAMDNFIKANAYVENWDGCTVELTGSWVWICGNTYAYKTEIKEKGFKYSKSKKKWYLAPYELGKKRRGIAFSKIKNKYGYESKTISASNRIN